MKPREPESSIDDTGMEDEEHESVWPIVGG
jgi:hypothetical protein